MKSTSPFVETQTAVYDPYAQSWRYLGIVATCNIDGSSCPRSLLWAAYVDPHYSGNGVRAYQYHQPYGSSSSSSSTSILAEGGDDNGKKVNGEWITTACVNPKKCAKLDCHEPHTHMRLLGIFKEPYYASEWFEQLFKHAGSCHWMWQQSMAYGNDGNSGGTTWYDYMQTYYADWPEQVCMATGEYGSVTVGSNNGVDGTTTTTTVQLYFDLKPGNSLRYGLYADSACRIEYVPLDGSRIDDEPYQQRVRSVAANLGYLADPDPFNRALHVFQSCQLCRSSNLAAAVSDDQNSFHCYDDADYRNVNQCMKFRTHTTMAAVNWHDLEAAYQQGVLDSITVQGQLMVASTIDARERQVGQTKTAVGALGATVVAAFLVLFWRMGRRQRRRRQIRAQPDLIERIVSL
jgi:hypothetical protein